MQREISFFLYNILLNMSVKSIFSVVLFFVLSACFAQERPQILTNLARNDGQSGQIELAQPEHMEYLLRMQITNNRIQEGIPGFRIRIFSQSGQTARQRADETRVGFMRNFSGIEAYQEYNMPNFQVFVGDFRTKSEALRVMKTIERRYPGAFIAPAIIVIK